MLSIIHMDYSMDHSIPPHSGKVYYKIQKSRFSADDIMKCITLNEILFWS